MLQLHGVKFKYVIKLSAGRLGSTVRYKTSTNKELQFIWQRVANPEARFNQQIEEMSSGSHVALTGRDSIATATELLQNFRSAPWDPERR